MRRKVTAVYKQGVLHPVDELLLSEGETVQLWIEEESQDEAARALEVLVAAGLVRPTSAPPDIQPVSTERRQELARTLGAIGPLSRFIIEERG